MHSRTIVYNIIFEQTKMRVAVWGALFYSGRSLYEHCDSLGYNEKYRKQLKRASGLQCFFVDHHLLPLSLKNHPMLIDVNMHSGQNLKVMPDRRAKHVDPSVQRHVPHPRYNRFVKMHLDALWSETDEEKRRYYLWLLVRWLDKALDVKGNVPF